MKKFYAIVAAVVLVLTFTIFAACEKDTPGTQPEVPTEPSVALNLSETEKDLLVGDSFTLTVNKEGTPEWSSDDPSRASVADGVVTALSPGTVRIYASLNGEVAACTVNITETPVGVDTLLLDKKSSTIYLGFELDITPVIKNGHDFVDISDWTLTWESSDPSIAAVSEEGVVSGINLGEATVSCTAVKDGTTLTASAAITVIELKIYNLSTESVDLLGDFAPLAIQDSSSATIELLAVDIRTLQETPVESGVTWSTADETVATVSQTGVVTGVSNGNTKVIAQYQGDTYEADVFVYAPISSKGQLDTLGKACYTYRDDAGRLTELMSANYMLTQNINYAGATFLPIAAVPVEDIQSAAMETPLVVTDVRLSTESQAWKTVLGLTDFSNFTGPNPTGATFTGIFDGSGYSIPTARLMHVHSVPRRAAAGSSWSAYGGCVIGTNDGIVRNIAFTDFKFCNNSDVAGSGGMQAVYTAGGIQITSIAGSDTAGIVSGNFNDAFALVTRNNGVIEDVFLSAELTNATYRAGGAALVVYQNNGTVSNVFVSAEKGRNTNTGFIAFHNNPAYAATISGCFAVHTLAFQPNDTIKSPILTSFTAFTQSSQYVNGVTNSYAFYQLDSFWDAVNGGEYSLSSYDRTIWNIPAETDEEPALIPGNRIAV